MTRRMIRLAHDPGDSQITSHCPFCGSGQVVGRSDGNIECEFCGMTYLVRVQPMFTGMPQQPMPPGAGFGGDTSMATDLMAPGMVGPDGLPLAPGEADPILAEEEGAGGVPFGEDGEEDEFGGIPESGPAATEGSEGAEGGFPPGAGEEDEEGFPPGEEGEEEDDGAPPWVKDKGSSPEKPGDKGKGDKKNKPKGKKGGGGKAPPFKKKSAQVQVQRTRQPQRSRYGDDEISGSSGGICSCKGCAGHPGRQCYAQVLQAGNECYACRNQPGKGTRAQAVYRTIAGDLLPEDAYIRHLAALHGGVEVLHRRAILHYDPHVREVLPLHMMSHHGWSPQEIREGLEWPERANMLPTAHDREHAHGYTGHSIPHDHEDVSFNVDPGWPRLSARRVS